MRLDYDLMVLCVRHYHSRLECHAKGFPARKGVAHKLGVYKSIGGIGSGTVGIGIQPEAICQVRCRIHTICFLPYNLE